MTETEIHSYENVKYAKPNFNQKEYFIIPLSIPKNITMSSKIYEKVVAVTCRKKYFKSRNRFDIE